MDTIVANAMQLTISAYRERDRERYDRWVAVCVERASDGQWAALVRALDELDELYGAWKPHGE